MPLPEEMLYIKYVRLREEAAHPDRYPYTVPAFSNFAELRFRRPVTFILGENGMGKSTLLEAIAVKAGFNAGGGPRNFNFATRHSRAQLYEQLVLGRGLLPRDGYFLRAEPLRDMASESEKCANGAPDYCDNKSHRYPQHGERFLSLIENRLSGNGLFLLDEPEAALSPLRQLYLLRRMRQLVEQSSQFIVSTHSPILMAYPGADIYEITDRGLQQTSLERTVHYRVLKRLLLDRESLQWQMQTEEY